MPRLPPSLFNRARRLNPHLATLLPACRDLASARRELRWIREHVAAVASRGQRRQRLGENDLDEKGVRKQLQQQHHHQPRVYDGGEVDKTAMSSSAAAAALVARLCARRGRGEPLQYVLGTQPFGPLEVRCRRGVLIPRPETEAWTARLADVLLQWRRGTQTPTPAAAAAPLEILDVSTGTGCVALLLEALLRPAWADADAGADARGSLAVTGLDIAPRALALARENARAHDARVRFERADIFTDAWRPFAPPAPATVTPPRSGPPPHDGGGGASQNHQRGLVANPPYISPRGFGRDTGRSVRNFEPRLALVPTPAVVATAETADGGGGGAPEDVFYRRLWQVADEFGAGAVALEVGDMAQARRVAALALRRRTRPAGAGVRRLEIWRDWPDMAPEEGEETQVEVLGRRVDVKGSGHGRVVVCWFGDVDVTL